MNPKILTLYERYSEIQISGFDDLLEKVEDLERASHD